MDFLVGLVIDFLCFNYFIRLKKTRILVRSTRAEALRTIHYLILAGSEHVRMVRKLLKEKLNLKKTRSLNSPVSKILPTF